MRPNTSIRILLAAAFILALVTVAWPTTSAVNVRFLGTGTPDFVVGKARMQAGILVDVEGERWLLDAGAGVNLPPEALRLIENGPGDSLFAAVQTLGLKLERRKAPLDVVVVDEAAKTPTEN